MIYLTNSFNHKMVTNHKHELVIEPTTLNEIKKQMKMNKNNYVNAIGHRYISRLVNLKPNRIQVQLGKGDTCYVISTTTRKKNLYPEPNEISCKKVTIIN